jgi:hypothetical protein
MISSVVRSPGAAFRLRSSLVRVCHRCEASATIVVPSENSTSRQGRFVMTAVAAMTRQGRPSSSKTSSPAARSPMVRQPLGVGMGVSVASALPSSRPATSSGSVTTS